MTFNEGVDSWFEKVVENPYAHYYEVQRLDKISQLRATKRNFNKFDEAVETLPVLPWSNNLRAFVKGIRTGEFKGEFRFTASRHRAQCSQVSELFSLFRQALHYHD
jgi:hypothetical protein